MTFDFPLDDIAKNCGSYQHFREPTDSPEFQGNLKKTFTLYENHSPAQFWYDCNGLEKSLSYGGQTIKNRYQNLYRKFEETGTVLNNNQDEQRQLEEALEEDGVSEKEKKEARLKELKAQEPKLEAHANKAKVALFGTGPKKGPMWTDLIAHLNQNLNKKNREAVKEEVTWRFSQNALVTCQRIVNEFTTKKFGGIFTAPHGSVAQINSCNLNVQKGVAKIEAHMKQTFPQFYSKSGEVRELDCPVLLDATMKYIFTPNSGLLSCLRGPVTTRAIVDINILEEQPII